MPQQFSFGAIFEAVARGLEPERPALVHGDQRRSWGELAARSESLAAGFQAAGAVPGDRVAHLMRNGPAYCETLAATFRARMVHVNVNYRYTGEELLYILDNSDAAVVVYDAEFAELLGRLRHRLPTRLWLQVGGDAPDWATDFEAMASAGHCLPPQDHQPTDMLFIYTGGTTGLPKGVMWDQGALWGLMGWGAPSPLEPPPESIAEHVANVKARKGYQKALVLPPLMHGTGLIIAMGTLSKGGTVVTLPGHNFDPGEAVSVCQSEACDYAVIVGDAFARPILKALDAGIGSIATLGVMISSGTMWSPEVKAGLLKHAPNMMIVDSLGSSEGLGLGAAAQTKDNAGAATKFMADGNTLIIGDDMKPVAPGTMGRIARGGLIPRGYWKDPVKTAATFPEIDGVRYSIPGDFAIIEEDGSFTLLGRGSQCINTGGEKVFPEEVEEVLKTHPAIDDALVFGLPDEKWGQCVTAVVEAHAPVDVEELRAHVRRHLAGYKTPKTVHIVKKVPRAPNGKADYATAKAMVTG
ncbi:AMP-binding protein [Sandarakinorhabdus oryzae]|uniref:AMP-binding protein n=1 Tax=Sandarakinorhabdus oryzae TaxID=2675220 RepID=UPI0012E2BA59|nr:AMP-binding protein [Sandarakinorhabdus oryzae]